MQVTGATSRALGWVLVVGGAVALVVGLGMLFFAADWVRETAQSGRDPGDDAGDTIEGLVLGGGAAAAFGFIGLLVGVFLVAIGNNLEKRHQRKVSAGEAKGRPKANE